MVKKAQKYFLMKIINHARKFFKGEINEGLIRERLDCFDDIDYREEVEYLPDFAVDNKKIKAALKKMPSVRTGF